MHPTSDQVIVNEYLPGQGISKHIDKITYFGSEIVTLSLGSTSVMTFRCGSTGQKEDLFLERRSLLVLTDEARYQWTHEIPGRKSDIMAGVRYSRGRRLSITLRTVLRERFPADLVS